MAEELSSRNQNESREEDEPFLPKNGAPAKGSGVSMRFIRSPKLCRISCWLLIAITVLLGIYIVTKRYPVATDGAVTTDSSRYLLGDEPGNDASAIGLGAADPKRLSKALVLASYAQQNVSWLEKLHHASDWKIYRYLSDSSDRSMGIPLPSSIGREALAYLTFIIDHYDDLPDIAVFIHGDDRAWHQPASMIDMLIALNLTAVEEEDFVHLRCTLAPGCTERSMFHIHPQHPDDKRAGNRIAEGFWQTMMAKEFGIDPPAKLGRRCCAQFAVTKDAIRQRSLDFWIRYRQPLLTNLDELKNIWGAFINEYNVGSMYENVWHIVFGKDPIFCPSKEHCSEIYFGGNIHCDAEISNYTLEHHWWETINCTNRLRPTEIE